MSAGGKRRSCAWLPALLGVGAACGGNSANPGPGAMSIPEAALLGGDTTVFDRLVNNISSRLPSS